MLVFRKTRCWSKPCTKGGWRTDVYSARSFETFGAFSKSSLQIWEIHLCQADNVCCSRRVIWFCADILGPFIGDVVLVVVFVLTLSSIRPASPMHRATRWHHEYVSWADASTSSHVNPHSLEVLLYQISPVHPWPARSPPKSHDFPGSLCLIS